MSADDPNLHLPNELRDKFQRNVPLCDLTTLRIGGPATLVCPVRTPEEAQRFQESMAQADLPAWILGGGSNVLAPDAGFPGLIMRVATDRRQVRGDTLVAGCGLDFDDLIVHALESGLTGLEFASGIPGTLGGALVGNAGCYGHEIGEFLVEALVLTATGRLERVGPEEFGFRYRATDLREAGHVLLEATLRLGRGDLDAAGRVRDDHLADRRAKHPVDLPCAGSWFRNLPPAEPGGRRRAAGELLEKAGAKAMSEGDAAVFAKHANIVVNRGAATGAQVDRLVRRMQTAVREQFGVDLVEEVRRMPGPGSA
ncbi:MAG: UDP-N-acetylmuramate dehydrogenase [bacterium]|nr:UDP-N-acetylmuramate dehydrogenase [bacterium]